MTEKPAKRMRVFIDRAVRCISKHPVVTIAVITVLVTVLLLQRGNVQYRFDISNVGIIVLAVVGLLKGLSEYKKTQEWKRAEFAASVLDKLNTNEDIRLALTLLDWEDRKIHLPPHYAAMNNGNNIFQHSLLQMAESFDMGNREISSSQRLDLKPIYRVPPFIIYVEVFDQLFEYFAQVLAFIQMKLIEPRDVRLLDYWIERILKLKTTNGDIFEGYLKQYFPRTMRELHQVLVGDGITT